MMYVRGEGFNLAIKLVCGDMGSRLVSSRCMSIICWASFVQTDWLMLCNLREIVSSRSNIVLLSWINQLREFLEYRTSNEVFSFESVVLLDSRFNTKLVKEVSRITQESVRSAAISICHPIGP